MSDFEYKLRNMQEQIDKLKSDYIEAVKFTDHVLELAKSMGIERLGINKTDKTVQKNPWESAPSSLFSKHKSDRGWPAVWQLAREAGIHGGCGNSDQVQINSSASLVDGIYQLEKGKWIRQ